jgi:hypothetical protein
MFGSRSCRWAAVDKLRAPVSCWSPQQGPAENWEDAVEGEGEIQRRQGTIHSPLPDPAANRPL